ncbi:MAG TPA: RNA polymerase sigma factor [Candidatus Hydrogenedentes bacterium]|nr:RNA polymerase sigma factor [Candidatus Hydrogenedentota bacterium]HIJ73275.1 RNA polymerase sigma factor [Candidatus Hydrogenedentota bacterium]
MKSEPIGAERTDEALMALVQDGYTDAFETLVKRYERPLFNYMRRMLGDAGEAEDLFQEAFLRVYTHRDRFRTTGRFRPWVYKIATNLCRDRLRKRRRRPEVSLDWPLGGEDAAQSLADRIASPEANPSDHAAASETAERLEAALAKLSDKHRAVFLMARYEGMAYDEIARSLHIPVGTVKSRMNKAVGFLMNALRETNE